MSNETFKNKLEAAGFKKVPHDHWIYSEGASIHLFMRPPSQPLKANKVAERLLVELRQIQDGGGCADVMELESLLELHEGESVSWVASTWIHPNLVNIYACKDADKSVSYVSTRQEDRGLLTKVNGPWNSLAEAKEFFGDAPEGWTDMEASSEVSVDNERKDRCE